VTTSVGLGSRRTAGGSIAVAMGVMNVATYAYTVLAARWLGPHSYGAFAALMGLLLVIGVLQLGLQATGARRIAANPGHARQIERSVLLVTYRAAAGLAVLSLLAAPLVDHTLRLDSLPTAALVALAAVPMTIMGGQAGVLQGERRWSELALLYLANGLARLAIGTALILWRPTEFAAMLGVVLSQFVPVVIGWWLLRGRATGDEPQTSEHHGGRAVLTEMAHNSHVLLAYFALSNVDVLVARSVLTEQQAGLYAAGIIVVKAVLFLPQFVVVLAFPSMSAEHTRERVLLASLAVVALLGTACTVGAKALSEVALVFVGGSEYAGIQDQLWLFAVLGTLLSMLQLLVYSVLARQARYAVYAVWAALVAVAVLGRGSTGFEDLLQVVLAVDGALFALLLGVGLAQLRRRRRLRAAAPSPDLTPDSAGHNPRLNGA